MTRIRRNGERVLISTHTISLQEQLVAKDIPLLNSVIPREFSAVLVKGRGNYLSLRRMNRAISKATSLLATDEQHSQLRAIKKWSQETSRRITFELPIRPDSMFGTRSPVTPATVSAMPASTTRSVFISVPGDARWMPS